LRNGKSLAPRVVATESRDYSKIEALGVYCSPMQSERSSGVVWLLLVLLLLLATGGATIVYEGYNRFTALSIRVTSLEAALATTTRELQKGLAESHDTLANALIAEQEKASALQSQFGSISGTVTTLQKLSTLDAQLLKKYSKVYFLNENYMPEQLVTIPKQYTYNEERDYTIMPQVLTHLRDMLDDAKDDGIEIYVQSAYRSFDEQQALKGDYAVVYGEGTANTFSADQGYSEHQLGTTVDFITTGLNGQPQGFDKTPAYAWLTKRAYRYGFILSYPLGNKYYIYEPWHWRFVGTKLADDLHDDGMNFYDMDQRKIDTYLANIF